MQDAINIDSLKYYRKKAGFHSQAELAEKLGCGIDQVNRWETGRTKKPNSHLRSELTKTLGVDWEKLSSPPPKDGGQPHEDLYTIQLNRRVRPSTRTALEVASAVYGVRWTDVLELAPLLFMIFAQQSLVARKKALEEARKHVEDAAFLANKSLAYIPGGFREYHSEENLLEEEEASIKRRDVFQTYEDFDGEETSPFVNHLQGLVNDLFRVEMKIIPGYGAPRYEVPMKILEQLTGVTGADKDGNGILELIQEGHLNLQEIRAKKMELDVNSYREWLEAKYQLADADIKARQLSLMESLDRCLKAKDEENRVAAGDEI